MSDLGNKEIFSRNLKYYMELNDKDRNDVCRDLDIPYTTFAEWYNGNIYPRIDKIQLLANYFDIKKSDLVEDKKNFSQDNHATSIVERTYGSQSTELLNYYQKLNNIGKEKAIEDVKNLTYVPDYVEKKTDIQEA